MTVTVTDLLATVTAEAEAEAAAVEERAAREAQEIRARAVAEAARRRAAFIARRESEQRDAIDRELALRRREQRENVLAARARLLEQVLGAVRRELAAVPVARYSAALQRLGEETVRYLEGRQAVLECPPEAAPTLRAQLGDRAGVAIEAREDARPGVVGRSADGDVTVDNTLVSRLDRMRPDLAIGLARKLLPG